MFRTYLVVLMLILVIVLVACNGGGETVAIAPPDETATATTEPTTVTAEPATATPEEPTAIPETPPTPEPSPLPAPTEVIEETPPEDGSEDAGQAGSDDGNAVSGSGWGASGSGPQSACDHPYLPIRSGASWTYQNADGTLVWQVVDVQGDMDEASAVLDVTVGDVSLSYHWQCVAGEGMASFDFASLSSAPVGIDMTLEQESIDGQFLIPADQLVPGASWTTELLSKISFSQEAEGTSIEVTGDMTTVQGYIVNSADPVEVNGQSVAGLQIEQINSMTMILAVMGVTTEQAFTVSNNFEMGYGIGIVNQTAITDFGTEETTLVEYSIP